MPALLLFGVWALAVISARNMTSELIDTSSKVNRRMAEQVRLVGVILQRSSELERKARLVVLLSDPTIREPYEGDAYEKTRQAYLKAIDDLNAIVTDPEILLSIQEVLAQEILINRKIQSLGDNPAGTSVLDQPFYDFNEMTLQLAVKLDTETEKSLDLNVHRALDRLVNYLAWNGLYLLMGLAGLVLALRRYRHPDSF